MTVEAAEGKAGPGSMGAAATRDRVAAQHDGDDTAAVVAVIERCKAQLQRAATDQYVNEAINRAQLLGTQFRK